MSARTRKPTERRPAASDAVATMGRCSEPILPRENRRATPLWRGPGPRGSDVAWTRLVLDLDYSRSPVPPWVTWRGLLKGMLRRYGVRCLGLRPAAPRGLERTEHEKKT